MFAYGDHRLRPHIAITRVLASDDGPRQLVAELDTLLATLYPPEQNFLTPIAALALPGVAFLVAHIEGELAGCGAVVEQDAGYGELKRIYVRPAFRGLGVGRRLVAALEQAALERGLPHLKLETGIYQPEAIALYQRCGYTHCSRFGDYPDSASSVFMHKPLTADLASTAR